MFMMAGRALVKMSVRPVFLFQSIFARLTGLILKE